MLPALFAILTARKTKRTTEVLLAGVIVAYMNVLTASACKKKLSDERKSRREALAYIIDSTGVPVCVLLLFSIWAIFSQVFFMNKKA